MIKRITSLILTLILLFQCIPLAYAVDTPDVNANAGGSGSGTSQTGNKYTWSSAYQGIRFTLLSS